MFKEHLVFIMPITSALIIGPVVNQHLITTPNNEPIEEVDPEALDVVMDVPLRRSKRPCRPAISNDYIIYLQKHVYDVDDVSDSNTYK